MLVPATVVPTSSHISLANSKSTVVTVIQTMPFQSLLQQTWRASTRQAYAQPASLQSAYSKPCVTVAAIVLGGGSVPPASITSTSDWCTRREDENPHSFPNEPPFKLRFSRIIPAIYAQQQYRKGLVSSTKKLKKTENHHQLLSLALTSNSYTSSTAFYRFSSFRRFLSSKCSFW